MLNLHEIDVNRKLNEGIAEGQDADKLSHELKQYHLTIWNARGIELGLFECFDDAKNRIIIVGQGKEIIVTPDSITNIFWTSGRKFAGEMEKAIIARYRQEDAEIEAMRRAYVEKIDYTIGSSLVFPVASNGHPIRASMNAARGLNYSVHDRMDLTLECIKRFYEGQTEGYPLIKTLNKSKDFFDLFKGFRQYVDFFFLNDLVDENYNIVGFNPPVSFNTPFPLTREDYKKYLQDNLTFIKKRNERIDAWINSHPR